MYIYKLYIHKHIPECFFIECGKCVKVKVFQGTKNRNFMSGHKGIKKSSKGGAFLQAHIGYPVHGNLVKPCFTFCKFQTSLPTNKSPVSYHQPSLDTPPRCESISSDRRTSRRLLPDESWQHLSCDDRCFDSQIFMVKRKQECL